MPTEPDIYILQEKLSEEEHPEEILGRKEFVVAEDLVQTLEIFKDIEPKTIVACQYYMRKTEVQDSHEP